MMIRVAAPAAFNGNYPQYKQNKPNVKFYTPTTPKEKVKKDFGIVLDNEMKRLNFERIV